MSLTTAPPAQRWVHGLPSTACIREVYEQPSYGIGAGAARASSAPSAADRTALAVAAPAGSAASRFSPPPIPPLETLGGHSVSAIEQRALVQRSGSAPAAAAQLALDSREPPVEPEVRSRLLRIVARQRMIDHVRTMCTELRVAERYSDAKSELRTKADRLVRATRDQDAQLLLAVAGCLTCGPGPASEAARIEASARLLCHETPRPGRDLRREQAEACRNLAAQLQEDQQREMYELGQDVERMRRSGASKDEIIAALRSEVGEFRRRGDSRDWLVSAMQRDISALRQSDAENRRAASEMASALEAASRRISELREAEAALRRGLQEKDEEMERAQAATRAAGPSRAGSAGGSGASSAAGSPKPSSSASPPPFSPSTQSLSPEAMARLRRMDAELRAVALENRNLRRELEAARARLSGAPSEARGPGRPAPPAPEAPPTVKKAENPLPLDAKSPLPLDAYSAAIAAAFGLHLSPQSHKFRLADDPTAGASPPAQAGRPLGQPPVAVAN
eukprot:tig00021720_g23178.t1